MSFPYFVYHRRTTTEVGIDGSEFVFQSLDESDKGFRPVEVEAAFQEVLDETTLRPSASRPGGYELKHGNRALLSGRLV